MFRKCGLYVLSFAVLSTGFSVLFSDVSSAASDYDDFFQTVNNVQLSASNYYGQTCPVQDVTQNWASLIIDNTEYPELGASYQNAINNGGRWGVSQYRSSAENYVERVIVYWTEDDSLQLNWNIGDGTITASGASGKFHSITITQNPPYSLSGDCDELRYFSNGNGANVSDKWAFEYGGYKNLFVYSDHLNIPSGYEGPAIPSGTDDNREIIKPDFKYTVNDKTLIATDHNQKLPSFTPDEGYTTTGFEVEWSLYKCVINDASPSSCNSPDLVDHQILSLASSYQIEVPEHTVYQLEAQYLLQQCYRYPSYPSTPDYCFYVDASTEFPDYIFIPTSLNLDIDGRIIIGDTSNATCDVSGFCVPQKIASLTDYFNNRENYGLTAVLLSPILFYQQIPSLASSCTPIAFSFNGRLLEIPCMGNAMQVFSPNLYSIYQAIVNAFVTYFVALGIFRTIKNVNDPKDDRIEVTTL